MEGQRKLDRQLWKCVRNQNVAGVIQAIENGANVHYIDPAGYSIIWYAMRNHNEEITMLLLNAGVCINQTSRSPSLLRVIASAVLYSPTYFKFLIANNADIYDIEHGFSVFFSAINWGNLSAAYILYEHGALRSASVNIHDEHHAILLQSCIRRNAVEMTEFLLQLGMRVETTFFQRYPMPDWWKRLETKRRNANRATLIVKTILRKRFKLTNKPEAAFLGGRIPKDVVELIGQYVWFTRVNKAWE